DVVDFATLKSIITTAEAHVQSAGGSNAWFALPIDVPRNAPPDVYQTLRQMREEVGIRATRGRGRMLQQMMETAGVMVGDGGWSLTDAEFKRRKALASLQNWATSGSG
ncbi:MAG: hypothetical protein AAGK74_16100, partial [Chloroflexota bacterium]